MAPLDPAQHLDLKHLAGFAAEPDMPYVPSMNRFSFIGPAATPFHDTHPWFNNLGMVPAPSGGLLNRQSWEPGGGGGSTQIHNVIHLDGAAIARVGNRSVNS